MIKREKMIEMLKRAIIAEEKAIPIYTRHLKTAVLWTAASKEKVDKIKEEFSFLSDECARHKKIIEALLKYVERTDKDAY